LNADKLQHIAGVGSSHVVTYNGRGAYFLDKLEDGIWRLEVMPDAVNIRDPFERPSLEKEVTRIQWENQEIKIQLPDLSNNFLIKGINPENNFTAIANENNFSVYPGTYLLTKKGTTNKKWDPESIYGNIRIGEFVAPKSFSNTPFVVHNPIPEVIAGKSFTVSATIVGLDSGSFVSLVIDDISWHKKEINFVKKSAYSFETEIPADLVKPGELSYWIVVNKDKMAFTFPGNYPGKPADWDFYHTDKYKTRVSTEGMPIEIFNASKDKDNLDNSFNRWGNKAYSVETVPTAIPGMMALKVEAKNLLIGEHAVSVRSFFGNKLNGRVSELSNFNEITVRARASNCDTAKIKLLLIDKDANSYGVSITLTKEFNDYHIPLALFSNDSLVLIPRPYPGFLPFWFKNEHSGKFDLKNIEVLEVAVGPGIKPSKYGNPVGFELEYIWLNRK
jgi:hypothetical protein